MGSVVSGVVKAASGGIFGAIGSLHSSSAAQSEARRNRRLTEQQVRNVEERKARELRIEREQLDREIEVAKEQAEWEAGISLEKAEFTKERIQEEANIAKASQIVGYAASGVSIKSGSPISVMARTAKTAEIEKEDVMRSHEIFTEARMKEVEEIEAGGEAAYNWFTERIEAETGYEIQGMESQISSYRARESNAKVGGLISAVSSIMGSYTNVSSYLQK